MKYAILFVLALLVGCSASRKPDTGEQLYDLAILNYDRGFYSQAVTQFKKVIEQNPGTQFATFSYLKMGDAQFALGTNRYRDAESNYRIFLSLNNNHHLVPYVLERLIAVNFKRNEHWFFGAYYDYERDPKPFKQIVTEHQRFYLLYPKSLYLELSRLYRDQSIDLLARHEMMVGDWYYKHLLYPSAIARYTYLLKNYPNFVDTREAVEKLIEAYGKNQQPALAKELERVYKARFGELIGEEKG